MLFTETSSSPSYNLTWGWHLQFVIDEDDILSGNNENILGEDQSSLGIGKYFEDNLTSTS